ncbi:hydrolase 1, exosortase A system-associated [Aquincola sp. J276]|uniref:hydrolase 1, exosortase A system-associated n=1 Tax=Aquincola sp. J276 TaxID=2898432 RepID=UPI002151F8CF|nr:hydrolase 1, exosortase A system-associated [Aquincola sp. J276]MCR5866039.1 hydrolase 1, exosortase A system-associated [Aquincola sp. J276]
MTAGLPYRETAIVFACQGEQLVGVLTRPAVAPSPAKPGVLVVVGGPQYRVGAHRQFVELARALASQGHAVLRFDARGMGDSSGALHDFLQIDDDIAAAIDTLCREAGVRQVVLWGLCDGASAALLYCRKTADPRVAGLALANPWVRSQESLAATHVKHYYLRRLLDGAFWRKLASGGVGRQAARELAGNLAAALRGRLGRRRGGVAAGPASYQDRMAQAWHRFGGPVLLLVSGDDYTAREFIDTTGSAPAWKGAMARPGLQRVDLPEADHTFSDRRYGSEVASATSAWLAGACTAGAAADVHRSTHA